MMATVFIVIIGWLYVALMMALAEATNSEGTIVGAVVTFVLYGVAPVAVVTYIMLTPARKRAIRSREAAEQAAARARESGAPDDGSEAPAGAIAPVREEP